MQKKIEMQGISRMLPQNVSNDGLSRDIINLRKYNSAWRPIGPDKSFMSGLPDVRPVTFFHQTEDGTYYVFYYNPSTGAVKYRHETAATETTLVTLDDTLSIRFTALHNVLIIIDETDSKMLYALYNMDSNNYTYIGEERFPDILNITFTLTPTDTPVIKNYVTFPGLTSEYYEQDDIIIDGELKSIEAEQNLNGYFTGCVALIYAFELFDGSVVRFSAPKFLNVGYWDYNGSSAYVEWDRYDLKYVIKTSDADLDTLRSIYKNIIKSVNIYMTRPLNTYKSDVATTTIDGSDREVSRDILSKSQRAVIQDPAYYLMQKISIEDVAYNDTDRVYSNNIQTIASLEAMPVDNYTHHKLYSLSDFVYNSRIFLSDLTTRLYKGYDPSFFIGPILGGGTGTEYDIYFEVDIKNGSGINTVRSDVSTFNYYDGSDIAFCFRQVIFFAYPDDRASTLRIMVDDGTTVYKAAEYSLKSHPSLNFSYRVFESDDISTYEEIIETDFTEQVLATVSDTILDRNRVQASFVDNPFYFPAINSYRVGSRNVVGLGANMLPVGVTQFGEYPIYVFCSDGIWVMNISRDASILIDSIKPAAPDVCSNKYSILGTSGGVIFQSERGIMLISGIQVKWLSKPLEGDYLSPLNLSVNYQDITASGNVSNISSYLDAVALSTFFATAKIGYNYLKEELIISNPSYNYSYLYSLIENMWYKSGKTYNSFVKYYPVMLGEINGVLWDITEEDWSTVSSYVPALIETYPIKLDIDSFKKIENYALRCLVDTDKSKGAGMYLFGSVDGLKWFNILSKEDSGTFRDLISGRANYSVIQAIMIFSGTLAEGSYITHIDIEFKERFRNRLR